MHNDEKRRAWRARAITFGKLVTAALLATMALHWALRALPTHEVVALRFNDTLAMVSAAMLITYALALAWRLAARPMS